MAHSSILFQFWFPTHNTYPRQSDELVLLCLPLSLCFPHFFIAREEANFDGASNCGVYLFIYLKLRL